MQAVWTCEFCGNVTEIKLEPEEVPKTEPLSFLIEGKPEVKSKKDEKVCELLRQGKLILHVNGL